VHDRFALTAALGEFVAGARIGQGPLLATALEGVVDSLGLIVKSRREPVVQVMRELCPSAGGASSVLLTQGRADAVTAATINATAAHALALDDVAWGCHPSAMLLPALLATGEEIDATGEAILRAWVVGYEVLGELASREPGSLHGTGWHPSGLLGPVAVAAAVAHLQGLDAACASGAIANACSFTGGITANFGTPIKALHAGRAAASGVLACALARRGQRGSPDVLERPGGFLETISPSGQVDLRTPLELGSGRLRLESEGNSLKRYPLCYSLHRIADAAIGLAQTYDVDAASVDEVEISLGVRQLKMAPHREPATGMQARYSAPFAAASGLVARAAGFAQLEPAFYASAPVRRLIERTTLLERHDTHPDDPVFAPSDRVRLRLSDGRWLDSGEVTHPRGHARNPLSAAERRGKFIDCLAESGIGDAAALFDRLAGLAEVDSIRRVREWVHAAQSR
jgi:aconitate decarboxylase